MNAYAATVANMNTDALRAAAEQVATLLSGIGSGTYADSYAEYLDAIRAELAAR